MKAKISKVIELIVLSLIFPIFMILGEYKKNGDSISVAHLILYILLSFILFAIYFFYPKWKEKAGQIVEIINKKLPKPSMKIALFLFGAVWIMNLLACFPGVFSYDCYDEYRMMVTNQITSHHPVLHVLVLGGLCRISEQLTGNGNLGILLYVLGQMALYAVIFYRILNRLREGNGRLAWYCVLFFWLLSPVINMYVIATTKDSVFAVFELAFLAEVFEISREGSAYFDKKSNSAWFIIVALMTMICRKNGVYIVLPVLIGLLIWEKGIRKKLLLCVIPILLVNVLYIGPFCSMLRVEPGSKVEMLPVPLQQLARTYKFNQSKMDIVEIEELKNFVKEEALANYRIGCADAVKNGVNKDYLEEHKLEFVKLWFQVGVKNPGSYLNAFLYNTLDFWYPLTVYDGYENLYGVDDKVSDYFDYRVAEPGVMKVLISPIHNYYNYLSTDLRVTSKWLPALWLNSGWYIMLWMMLAVVSLFHRKKELLHVHGIMLWSFLTVLAGPMALVRYVLIFYMAVPLIAVWILNGSKGNNGQKD